MRDRLQLQSESRTSDGGGGFATTWSTLATVWGRVVPRRGAERREADRVEDATVVEFEIRYRTGISAAQRLVHVPTGDTYNIRSVINPDARRRFLRLVCERGVAA